MLASQSPRRSEILRQAGIPFTVRAAGVDESVLAGEQPADYVQRLAAAKAHAVEAADGETILGADTTVVVDGEILGKPENADDARRMLRLLSGRRHDVLTGICLRRGTDAIRDCVTTGVIFATLSDAEIARVRGHRRAHGQGRRLRHSGPGLEVRGAHRGRLLQRDGPARSRSSTAACAKRFRPTVDCPPPLGVYNTDKRTLDMYRLTGVAAALAMWWAGTLAGQVKIEPRPRPAPPKQDTPGPANIRVDTTLILVPVSVNDPLNRPVSGLEKENFRVFEDKVPQTITQFAMDDEPVAVGLVFDTSGSMGDKLQRSRMAAKEFFRIANPEDEFFLVEFDSAPKLRVPLTSDTGTIENELIFSKSKGSTALLDAIYLALHEMKRSKKNKKALLMISDGGDNHSRYSAEGSHQPGARKRRADLFDRRLRRRHDAGGSRRRRSLLAHISEQSGGRLFEANPVEMPDIAKKIGIELRNRYILGYSPQNLARDGKYRRITVQVVPPRGLPKLSRPLAPGLQRSRRMNLPPA